MTRFPHDEFAKGFLESLLSPFGQVQTSFKVSSEVREIDIYFRSNDSTQIITELGLLGKIAQTDFVLEPFRNPPTGSQIRACMGKLFDLHADLIREAKRSQQPEPKITDLPKLWILAPTLSQPILEEFGMTLVTQLTPSGVYLAPSGYKTGIIVIHQLPKTPATLWFRLLGKGKVQSIAITEVAALPSDSPCRQDALSWLGNLRVILEARETQEPEEEELMMQLSPLFLEKLQAAEERGEVKGQQDLVLRQLNRRMGNNVSLEVVSKVKLLSSLQLEALGEALLDFDRVENLIDWLDTHQE